jgi:hypothetical protein
MAHAKGNPLILYRRNNKIEGLCPFCLVPVLIALYRLLVRVDAPVPMLVISPEILHIFASRSKVGTGARYDRVPPYRWSLYLH